MTAERNLKLLGPVHRGQRVIEIGASYNPVASRAEGWNTTIVDHDSREGLLAKYEHTSWVDRNRIEAVDVVWREGPLHLLFPTAARGTYNALIASHVIEHLLDPVGFLESCAALLHPVDATVVLAIPDKRLSYDFFRPGSTTGQLLAAHGQVRTRHSVAALFDEHAWAAALGPHLGWQWGPLDALRLANPLEKAIASWTSRDQGTDYIDCHAWQFTPAQFQLLILELSEVGVCGWHIDWIEPMPEVEFLVRLRRGAQTFPTSADREARRFELLKAMLLEVRQQTDWLLPRDQPPMPASETQRQQLDEIAQTAAMLRTAIEPVRQVWRALKRARKLLP